MKKINEDSFFGSRLMEFIIAEGLNINSFSKKIGMSDNSAVTRLVSDRDRGPSLAMLQATAMAFPLLNLRWLLVGEGTMFGKLIRLFIYVSDIYYIKYHLEKSFHDILHELTSLD